MNSKEVVYMRKNPRRLSIANISLMVYFCIVAAIIVVLYYENNIDLVGYSLALIIIGCWMASAFAIINVISIVKSVKKDKTCDRQVIISFAATIIATISASLIWFFSQNDYTHAHSNIVYSLMIGLGVLSIANIIYYIMHSK